MSRFYSLMLLVLIVGCSSEPPSDRVAEKAVPTPSVAGPRMDGQAAEPPAQPPSPAPPHLVLDQDFLALDTGDRFALPAAAGIPYDIEITSRRDLGRGITELTGELAGGGHYHMTATVSESGVFGRIQTPETVYQLTVIDGKTVLVDLYGPGVQVLPRSDADSAVPPRKQPSAGEALPSAGVASAPPIAAADAQAGGLTTIDVMVLYTPGLAAKYPGDLLDNRLTYLITLANQAYSNSNIGTNLRLVHAEQVPHTDSQDNAIALEAFTNNEPPFAGIESLREAHGADLVVLLRPFSYPAQVSCGVAWILGTYGPISTDSRYGYAVVSDGNDSSDGSPSGYYCTDLTMAHEIGHNLGSVHDRNHSSSDGAYSFSYGYGFEGGFGTVMSYYWPEVDSYSSPNLQCGPYQVACGIAAGQPGEADNSLSINTTSAAVAAFRQKRYSADVNGDGTVDLRDTILALQLSSGRVPSQAVKVQEDINGDGKIGLEEAIHSLTRQAQ